MLRERCLGWGHEQALSYMFMPAPTEESGTCHQAAQRLLEDAAFPSSSGEDDHNCGTLLTQAEFDEACSGWRDLHTAQYIKAQVRECDPPRIAVQLTDAGMRALVCAQALCNPTRIFEVR
eukprot:9727228-Alexandrium_andersonii.AAC.1